MNHRPDHRTFAAWTVALVLSIPTAGAAEPAVVFKLGTLAPKGSSFEKILMSMGAKWAGTPGGPTLRIYPGGTAGGEGEMVRRMKIGQLDAALLTANGLADVDRSVQSLQSIPMMFRSLDEVEFVTAKLRPRIDRLLREKKFVVLCWIDVGWVRFFSKTPIHDPEDLKKAKLFTWAGDSKAFDLYKSAGFHPVALETSDALPMLSTGMITAVPSPPYGALLHQIFTAANHMLELDWAPLVGALVVREASWNKLSAAAQLEMARAAAEAGPRMTTENRRQSDEAVEAMKKRGLTVYRPTAGEVARWRTMAEGAWPKIRGNLVPAEFFDEVKRLLDEYRSAHPPARALPARP